MRIFIFEHVCGGGFAGEKLPARLVAQGGGMLRAVVEDFVALGHEVSLTLDMRIELDLADNCHAHHVEHLEEVVPLFDRLAAQADAALVIAPESESLLAYWLRRLERTRTRSLGCSISATERCTDKLALARYLRAAGIPTPPTHPYSPEHDPLGAWPRIVKPVDGAGGEEVLFCEGPGDLAEVPDEGMIVQPVAPGMPASFSVIVEGERIVPLLAGRQRIEKSGRRLIYRGGDIPLGDDLAERARRLALQTVRVLPGLRGFVGIDLLLAERPEDDCVIEVNPRLTVSYVPLRRLATMNLAQMLLHPGGLVSWQPAQVAFDAAGHILQERPLMEVSGAGKSQRA